ncbi:hypothetical protein BOP96_01795 [Pseudomonas sp. FSL W5-0203]|nr:hypothetical protein BOP96_01795 [Pseudomonas sp. FSL W5-0203]
MTIHLAYHGRQLTAESKAKPSTGIVIQCDLSASHAGRFDSGQDGPAANYFVITLTTNEVQIKGLFLVL